MKKTLAILLALLLVLVNVAALAEESAQPKYKSSAAFSFEPLPKEYTVTGTTDKTLYPQETLEFAVSVKEGYTNPDGGEALITVGANKDNTVVVTGVDENTLKINVPELSMPGLYHWTITEKEGNTQGVTYDTTTKIGISVLVTFSATDAAQLEVLNTDEVKNYGITATGIDEETGKPIKLTEITNKYDLGTLTVSKNVTGNMGDRNQLFDIKVTFEAEGDVLSDITIETESQGAHPTIIAGKWEKGKAEANIQLKHGESLTFKDIPAGVTYTVVEDAKHAVEDRNGGDGSKGYEITYNGEEAENATGTISVEASTVAINNDKAMEIDTGVNMETVPYILLLAVAMIGIAVLKLRKREEY